MSCRQRLVDLAKPRVCLNAFHHFHNRVQHKQTALRYPARTNCWDLSSSPKIVRLGRDLKYRMGNLTCDQLKAEVDWIALIATLAAAALSI